ncbi:hypothetical protein VO71_21105 [Aeromonas salmonicida subsp. smithia]|nr:hypothetical protein VO71_21105 [Aeromonas salmonicida subsp. smithia]
MTQERIQTRYRLAGTFTTQAELEQAIARAIEAHKQDFFPLLERLVDVGDNRGRCFLNRCSLNGTN